MIRDVLQEFVYISKFDIKFPKAKWFFTQKRQDPHNSKFDPDPKLLMSKKIKKIASHHLNDP